MSFEGGLLDRRLSAAFLLLMVAILAVGSIRALGPSTSSSSNSSSSMVFLGKVKKLVVRGEVLAYIREKYPGLSGIGKIYEIHVDFHGRVVKGLTPGLCTVQQMAVSDTEEYAAFINMSVEPQRAYALHIRDPGTGKNYTSLAWGYGWNLVLVSREGERVLASGVMPATPSFSSASLRVVPSWGCPMVAFREQMIYLYSVDILENRPIAEIYIINPETGEERRVIGILQPTPATMFVPLGDNGSFISFTGYDFGGFVVKPEGLYGLVGLTEPLLGDWECVEGGALVASVGHLYLITPQPSYKAITGSGRGFSVAPNGRFVAVIASGDLHLYNVTEGEFREVFAGFDPEEVKLSNKYMAFREKDTIREEDTITVVTYPPIMRIVAKLKITGKFFTGPDGVTYLLRLTDFYISDHGLTIVYTYRDISGDTNYVVENIGLAREDDFLKLWEGDLAELRRCSIHLSGPPRSATYSGGVLVVSTDDGIIAYKGCEKLWETSYPHALILGARDGVLYVYNGTTYSMISLDSGELIAMFALPTKIGGGDISYFYGELLEDGTAAISGLISGQASLYILIRGTQYELVPTKTTSLLAAGWEQRYVLAEDQCLLTPSGKIYLPTEPWNIYVVDDKVAIGTFDENLKMKMLLILDRNASILLTTEPFVWISPVKAGKYPGALLVTMLGKNYRAILAIYTGDTVAIYRKTSQSPLTAAYGEGVLAVVAYGEDESTITYYEVKAP